MAVDSQAFKQAMSQFASGVTVVTTVYEGQRYGLTASSFTSLSLDPPLVLVCLGKKLRAHDLIETSGVFAVNVLGAHQLDLGMRFAGLTPAKDRFEGLATTAAATGSPLLPDVLCWVDCRLRHLYEGGDHSIFVGEVIALSATTADTPLLYHNRLWRRSESWEAPTLPLRVELTDSAPVHTGLSAKARARLVEALAEAGVRRQQVGSFVPGAETPAPALTPGSGILTSALVGEEKGLERAAAAGVAQVELGISAGGAASPHRHVRSPEENVHALALLVARARAAGLLVRVSLLGAFGSAGEGDGEVDRVLALVRRLAALPLDELGLVDSAGRAHPHQVRHLAQEARPLLRGVPLVLHLRDTRGMGLANLLSALRCGVDRFDTALGGRGGPPFLEAPGGNVATENAVHMLHAMGLSSGIDLVRLEACSSLAEALEEGRS